MVQIDGAPILVSAPPTSRIDWSLIATTIRQDPGQWYVLPRTVAPQVGTRLRAGRYEQYGLDPDHMEVTQRTHERIGGAIRVWIYLKWVP